MWEPWKADRAGGMRRKVQGGVRMCRILFFYLFKPDRYYFILFGGVSYAYIILVE